MRMSALAGVVLLASVFAVSCQGERAASEDSIAIGAPDNTRRTKFLSTKYTVESARITIRELGYLISGTTGIPVVVDPRDTSRDNDVRSIPLDLHVSFRMVDAELSEILSAFGALIGLDWVVDEYQGTPVIIFSREE